MALDYGRCVALFMSSYKKKRQVFISLVKYREVALIKPTIKTFVMEEHLRMKQQVNRGRKKKEKDFCLLHCASSLPAPDVTKND